MHIKQVYEAPVLKVLGSVADLTQSVALSPEVARFTGAGRL